MSKAIYWRCFHCGNTFTRKQEKHAKAHFGTDCSKNPVCLMRIPGEYHLLRALRNAEDQLQSYRSEDGDMLNAMMAMQSDHRQEVRRAEEIGYQKALDDLRSMGRLLPEPEQPCVEDAEEGISSGEGPGDR